MLVVKGEVATVTLKNLEIVEGIEIILDGASCGTTDARGLDWISCD